MPGFEKKQYTKTKSNTQSNKAHEGSSSIEVSWLQTNQTKYGGITCFIPCKGVKTFGVCERCL
jgi:hypothetical protein